MKTWERQRARELRAVEGASIKEIARLVGVSRSSLSLWVKDEGRSLAPIQEYAGFEHEPWLG